MNLWYAGELKELAGISAGIKGWEPPWPCFKELSPLLKFRAFPWTWTFPMWWNGRTRLVGIVTTGTACPGVSGCITIEQQILGPLLDCFLSNYLSTFHQTTDEGEGTWDQHEHSPQTHMCTFDPCSWAWQGLNLASSLECVCANIECALRGLVETAWQPSLKPVCFYIWIIFGCSIPEKKRGCVRSRSRGVLKLF